LGHTRKKGYRLDAQFLQLIVQVSEVRVVADFVLQTLSVEEYVITVPHKLKAGDHCELTFDEIQEFLSAVDHHVIINIVDLHGSEQGVE
jgi:hypothetical protein